MALVVIQLEGKAVKRRTNCLGDACCIIDLEASMYRSSIVVVHLM